MSLGRARGLGGRPWQERYPRTSAGPQVPLGEVAAPQPRSARWRRAAAISRPSERRAPPGSARPGPARSGAVPPPPPRCSCFPGSARLPQVPPPPQQCGPPPSLPPPVPHPAVASSGGSGGARRPHGGGAPAQGADSQAPPAQQSGGLAGRGEYGSDSAQGGWGHQRLRRQVPGSGCSAGPRRRSVTSHRCCRGWGQCWARGAGSRLLVPHRQHHRREVVSPAGQRGGRQTTSIPVRL